ncbi:MAG TPA: hypothetical protein VMV89_09600 [Candidatus Paceibacterota bacterium]|nr:hypothetical protein [Candidatus Paceibacterota bacterium]
METKPDAKTNATHESAKNLMCWRTATSPQCLRVETTTEIHLFVYGYFQHAKFIRQNGKEIVQIQFQDRVVLVKGKNLEPLCDALERLAVERIKACPEKYGVIARNEGVIEDIEIKQRDKEN